MIPKKRAPDLIRGGTGFRKRSCVRTVRLGGSLIVDWAARQGGFERGWIAVAKSVERRRLIGAAEIASLRSQ
jgi:NAD/NADP transhydrogenase alpha subunit